MNIAPRLSVSVLLILTLMAATGFIYSAEPIGAAAVNFSFATPETARNILTNRDAFINALSPFDRSARMQTDRSVSEEEFLAFLGENVRRWSPQARAN